MKKNQATSLWSMGAIAGVTLACSLVSSALTIPGITGDAPVTEPPLLEDDFSDSESGWGTGTDSDSAVEYEDGVLRMTSFRDYYFTWSTPDEETYKDVHLEVTVNNESGDAGMSFGVLCHQQVVDSSFHYFAVTTDGDYAIARAEIGKEDVFLTNDDDWGTSGVISAGASSYRVGADCRQGELTLFVNGTEVDSVSDPTFTEGGVGLFLWSADVASGAISYDDFVMTPLK